MGHPQIDNRTPFAFAPLFIADEEGRPIVTTIVKATFDVSARGVVSLGEKQAAVDFTGKPHGEPGKSSPRLESETAFVKPGTDCVLLGHAVSASPTTQMDVGIRIGPLTKGARVTGDRWWVDGSVGLTMSAPEPFRMMPLVYERAFGGWDRTSEKEDEHDFEPRNPVGVGFVGRKGSALAGSPLPNIEDPRMMLTSPGGKSVPIGFGFVGAEWQPRAKLAGTFDEAWTKNRSPRLPTDFDRAFFNAASEGLVTVGYLRGDEWVQTFGVTPEGKWEFRLPGIDPPRVTVAVRFGDARQVQTNLDTVIVDADARRLTLIWRAFTSLRSGPHDVSAMRIETSTAVRAPSLGAPAATLASVS